MNANETKPDAGGDGVLRGKVRVDEKTRRVATRLEPGEIAVIDQPDLDRAAAEALVEARPVAVLNAAVSSTGRHPVLGPVILHEAGILLVDDLGADLMGLREGDEVEIRGDEVWSGGVLIASRGDGAADPEHSPEVVSSRMIRTQVASFAASIDDYLSQDGHTVFEGRGVPTMSVSVKDRVVLLVVDSPSARAQLTDLKPWIRDSDPVVVAVEGGATHARRAGLKPTVVVGDMDLVPEKILRCGAQLIVRSGRDGVAPGLERLERMGLAHDVIEVSGSAEDAATLVAAHSRPTAIVTVGESHSLQDYLDRGRGAMAPSFFTRLSAQDLLVPATAVIATYRPRVRVGAFVVLALAALVATGAALWSTPWGHDLLSPATSALADLLRAWWPGTPTT
ncbi:thiamine pyrophosphokinase [Schaalia sp. 19OD2882]|uniref:putative cytokinetic ring protein SteA n=1 Tax=Schaalia sp. 19OD2882 TaxID=2794089 RepID=UPI001C1F12BD|nr:putative cytokinetic ring protein SteA [Schaalia sp. 19OD2882]QWW18759.1 thiamine pyrophosphokinase [Schaalia sp. 19OD2882]